MPSKENFINLHPPKISGNRLLLSWEPHPLLTNSSYWIEYLNLKEISADPESLLEAYLPICLAFSALGDVTITLPGSLDSEILKEWEKICADTSRVLFKKISHVKFIASQGNVYQGKDSCCKETALLFGGGTESLLALAHLLDEGIRPYLVSLWGPRWQGSDPDLNSDRFTLEEDLCREFGLKVVRIHTNIRDLFDNKRFIPYLRYDVFIINAALFLPINVSATLPVARQLGIGTIISGNEKESSSDIGYYSLSNGMTKNLHSPGKHVKYRSALENQTKMEIIEELHCRHPGIAKYQYSCWRSVRERWCHNCEKCLRNYFIYKIIDIDPATVGMDEKRMLSNLDVILCNVRKECRKHKALVMEWKAIKAGALKKNKKNIADIIESFCNPGFIKRFFPSKINYEF